MNFAFIEKNQSSFKTGIDKPIKITLQNEQRQAINLTGATVKVRIATASQLLLEKAITISDAAKGIVQLSFTTSEDLDSGSYDMELEVTYSNGTKEIFPDSSYLKIKVMKALERRENTFEVSSDLSRLKADLTTLRDTASTNATDAKTQADYAKAQGDYAKSKANEMTALGTPMDQTVTFGKVKNPLVKLMHNNSLIVDFQAMQVKLATAGSLYIYDDSGHNNYGANQVTVDLAPLNLLSGTNYNSYRIYLDRDDSNKLKVTRAQDVTAKNFTLGFIYQDRVIGNENGIKVIDINGFEKNQSKIGESAVNKKAMSNVLWEVLLPDAVEINFKDNKVYLRQDIHALYGQGYTFLGKTVQPEYDFSAVYTTNATYKLYMDTKDSNKLKMVSVGTDTKNNPVIAFVFAGNVVAAVEKTVYAVSVNGRRQIPVPNSTVDLQKIKNPILKMLWPDTLTIDFTTNKVSIAPTSLWAYDSGGMFKYVEYTTFTPLDIDPTIMSSTDYSTYALYLDFTANGTNPPMKIARIQDLTGDARILTRMYQKKFIDNPEAIKVIGGSYMYPTATSRTNQFAHVYEPNAINIDTTNKKIIVKQALHIIGPNGNNSFTNATYPLEIPYTDNDPSSYVKKLYFNLDTKTLNVGSYANVISANTQTLLFWEGTGASAKCFDPFENYKKIQIDGIPYSERTEAGALGGGFAWATNKFVLPKELYLLKGVDYSINAQNFNYNKYTDNDSLLFEVVTPSKTVAFENNAMINSPVACDFETYVAGIYNNNKTDALVKDMVMRFADPATKTNKSPKVLCIGDSITQANIPYLVKWWLQKFGFTPTMIGTQDNGHETYGYGLEGTQPTEKGEGRGGWRLTDFTGTTKRLDGTTYLKPNNPFWNPTTQAFDFSYYMTQNGFTGVDYVVIMVGTNDITTYHGEKVAENIASPSIDEVLAYMPGEFQKIVDSILAYNPNCKIGLNPPVPAGGDDSFNAKAARFTELQQKTFDNPSGGKVFGLGTYLADGRLSGKTFGSDVKTPVDSNNNTYRRAISNDVHDAGNNQLVNALWSASWIINRSS